jgi:hypothetical protein
MNFFCIIGWSDTINKYFGNLSYLKFPYGTLQLHGNPQRHPEMVLRQLPRRHSLHRSEHTYDRPLVLGPGTSLMEKNQQEDSVWNHNSLVYLIWIQFHWTHEILLNAVPVDYARRHPHTLNGQFQYVLLHHGFIFKYTYPWAKAPDRVWPTLQQWCGTQWTKSGYDFRWTVLL